jgi:hypothetical protein
LPPSTTELPAQVAPASGAWATLLLLRVRRHWLLKMCGISAFMWAFFVAYFYLLRHPARPVTIMPLTAIDDAIGLQPAALVAYVSLWVYVGVAPGLLMTLRELLHFGLWVGGLCLTGLGMFYLWPTAVPPREVGPDLAQHPGFALLQGVDAAGNACPSLHVATALFNAIWVWRLLGRVGAPRGMHVFNTVWLLLIVYSTLAIKQHVLLDALAGAALGAAFGWASLRSFAARGNGPE